MTRIIGLVRTHRVIMHQRCGAWTWPRARARVALPAPRGRVGPDCGALASGSCELRPWREPRPHASAPRGSADSHQRCGRTQASGTARHAAVASRRRARRVRAASKRPPAPSAPAAPTGSGARVRTPSGQRTRRAAQHRQSDLRGRPATLRTTCMARAKMGAFRLRDICHVMGPALPTPSYCQTTVSDVELTAACISLSDAAKSSGCQFFP